ncbi:hypothetical protein LTR04_001352 [Oleoguttula sp. CCFEE 6159]|nr:hypothetical protein LTR04_001352 [Oleoguttula sp. CCFEE 6159]
MNDEANHLRRQLWVPATTTYPAHRCTPFILPSLGTISLDSTSTITLTRNVVFQPECTGIETVNNLPSDPTTIANLKDPFYASSTPQTYAIASATIISWMLVIMLLITPRKFVGGAGGGSGFLGGRGMIGGASGNGTTVGVGSRPWLQKAAALTVAVSLTIATSDTFVVAQQQYEIGYMDAAALCDAVAGSLEIRITRIISNIFLWLAQVQTLIRLFPRHKEKVLIKWIGFALIVLDTIFSCLTSFMGSPDDRQKRFVDAVPALGYLFQLALSLLYAAWVMYYALTKRKYAFYHPNMRNICLVALLSFVAILTPVAFFVTDISNQDVAGWGDYFRWVGAAAASVVVWEWVERIETLEREEKKDGILGRETFDADEMLEVTPSEEIAWPGSRRGLRQHPDGRGGPGGAYSSGATGHGLSGMARRLDRSRTQQASNTHGDFGGVQSTPANQGGGISFVDLPRPVALTAPLPVVSPPVSRADTTSAASTVYTVRFHPVSEPSPPIPRKLSGATRQGQEDTSTAVEPKPEARSRNGTTTSQNGFASQPRRAKHPEKDPVRWQAVANPFKRKRASPPPEVQNARMAGAMQEVSRPQPLHNYPKWDIKSRLGAFAADQGEKFRERANGRRAEIILPVTIIPAQPRGRTWSPETLQQSLSPRPGTGGTNLRPASQEEVRSIREDSAGNIRGDAPLQADQPSDDAQRSSDTNSRTLVDTGNRAHDLHDPSQSGSAESSNPGRATLSGQPSPPMLRMPGSSGGAIEYDRGNATSPRRLKRSNV